MYRTPVQYFSQPLKHNTLIHSYSDFALGVVQHTAPGVVCLYIALGVVEDAASGVVCLCIVP